MWSYPALNSRIVSSPPQTANNRSTTIGVSHLTLIARYRSVQSCPICSWRVAVRMRTKAFITSGSLGHKAALHHPSLVFLFTCNQFVHNYSLHMRSFIYILYARAAVPVILSRLLCRAHARAWAQRHTDITSTSRFIVDCGNDDFPLLCWWCYKPYWSD